MRRIAGSPHNDNAFHSYDIQRELSLSSLLESKGCVHSAGVKEMRACILIFHAHREVFIRNRGAGEGQ